MRWAWVLREVVDRQRATPLDDRYVLRSRMAIDVKDYGAVGDSATDDAGAIQRAIEAPPATGGGLYRLAVISAWQAG